METDGFNGGPGTDTNGTFVNGGLLQSVGLDRNAGARYTIRGNTTWSAEYDRSYRQGIYLFGDDATLQDAAEAGALGLFWHVDDVGMTMREGFNGSELGVGGPLALTDGLTENDLFTNVQLNFIADVRFLPGDQLRLNFTLEHDFAGSPAGLQTNTLTTNLTASNFEGSLFGFASRTRDDGRTDSIINWQSFSIEQTAVPEHSTFMLIAFGCMGVMSYVRRRK